MGNIKGFWKDSKNAVIGIGIAIGFVCTAIYIAKSLFPNNGNGDGSGSIWALLLLVIGVIAVFAFVIKILIWSSDRHSPETEEPEKKKDDEPKEPKEKDGKDQEGEKKSRWKQSKEKLKSFWKWFLPNFVTVIGFVILLAIGYALFCAGRWIYAPMPSTWKTTITINPHYNVSFYTLESNGKCSQWWIKRVSGSQARNEDGDCFGWDIDFKHLNLEATLSNGVVVRKPAGLDFSDVLGYAAPSVMNLRTTDGSSVKMNVTLECKCQDR